MTSTVTINGISISGGRSIVVTGNKVFIDGQDVTPDAKQVQIFVTGNVEKIEADTCYNISITGDAGSVHTQSGSVDVKGSIRGSVQTMSGSVESGGPIGGSVSTMSGNVRHR